MHLPGGIYDSLTLLQKKCVFKIVVELVKADSLIHENEVQMLDNLRTDFSLTQEDLDASHYISLEMAVDSLRQLPAQTRVGILSLFERTIRVDNDVDAQENLFLSALKLALGAESASWCGIVSVTGVDVEVLNSQVVYLEEEFAAEAHQVFDDESDFLLVSKAIGDIGLQLFYLPQVKKDLDSLGGASRSAGYYSLLQRALGYLAPFGDKDKMSNISAVLQALDAMSFYKIVLSRYGITPDRIAPKSFLLLKIRDSYVLDDDDAFCKTVDFLYLDTQQEVKRRILSFVSVFNEKAFRISYEGYYRILFDFLSSESKLMSRVRLDEGLDFFLCDISASPMRFESSPQSRSFYLLLLHKGPSGIEQSVFEQAVNYLQSRSEEADWDVLSFEEELVRKEAPWADLIYNLVRIYGSLSTKDVDSPSFLKYILTILRHRSSLKNYINNGFMSEPRLANKAQYCVAFNALTKSYYIPISLSMFEMVDASVDAPVKLSESSFWQQLR